MSDLNSIHNTVVWFDLPVADLERASNFYGKVLATTVHVQSENGQAFAVLQHSDGSGGCLVPCPSEISSEAGALIYLNVQGRIRDAVRMVEELGGTVLQPIHSIGPHGFRTVVLDSEGNRVALHSHVDD